MQISGADSHAAQIHNQVASDPLREQEAARHQGGAEEVRYKGKVDQAVSKYATQQPDGNRNRQDVNVVAREEQKSQEATDVTLFDRNGRVKPENPRAAVDVVV
jgi:hypothetical protein